MLSCSFVGTAATVRAQLDAFAREHDIDAYYARSGLLIGQIEQWAGVLGRLQ